MISLNICIVGGGIGGLTAAYELSKAGHRVFVYEKEQSIGGLVDTVAVNRETVEKFYHHIFTTDSEIIALVEELGLKDVLRWYLPRNAIFINNKLYPFTSPVDLLMFRELAVPERIKMGLTVLKAARLRDWKALEEISAKEWIVNNAGKNVYEKVFKPLLYSKFGADAENISAVWIWNKFKLRGTTRGKNLNREMLGYMDGSFKRILDTLVERITQNGGQVFTDTCVTEIVSTPDNRLCITAGGEKCVFDRVVVTAAPAVLGDIAPELPESYVKRLSGIKYKANICVMLEMSDRLSPWYWITVAGEDFPFVLAIEHTNLVQDGRYNGSILYLSRYLDPEDEMYRLLDDSVTKIFVKGLKRIFPDMDESIIKNIHVNRALYAQPVVTGNYPAVLPDFCTPVKNLYIASMAQIYPEDRGQNYAVLIGKKVAKAIEPGGIGS